MIQYLAMTDSRDKLYARAFARLARSKFRASFSLGPKERAYAKRIGLDAIRSHAIAFVRDRLAAAHPANDGHQTPMHGHPVFIAQHATATCCRSCLEKWWHVPQGTAIPLKRQCGIVDFLMAWIERQLESPGEKKP